MSFVFLQKGIEKTSIYYVHRKKHNNFFFRFYILCWHRAFRVNLYTYSVHCLHFIPAWCFWGFTLKSNLNWCYFFWILFLKRTSKWTAVNTQVVSKSQNDYLDIHWCASFSSLWSKQKVYYKISINFSTKASKYIYCQTSKLKFESHA